MLSALSIAAPKGIIALIKLNNEYQVLYYASKGYTILTWGCWVYATLSPKLKGFRITQPQAPPPLVEVESRNPGEEEKNEEDEWILLDRKDCE
jgi:hypothetical protein